MNTQFSFRSVRVTLATVLALVCLMLGIVTWRNVATTEPGNGLVSQPAIQIAEGGSPGYGG